MSELRRVAADPGLIAECSTQLGFLFDLQKNIATATPAMMASMRAEIAASMEAVASIAQQARAAASDAALGAAQLAATTAATLKIVTDLTGDLYERHIFDPYLKFASKEDEAEYHQREAENQRYIREQLEKNTPEGTLNAAGATTDQMLDANAHGAGDSPDFAPRWNRLVETTNKQREALRQEGHSTEEFDRNINASVRRFLKAKGLSDAQIDATLAESDNPLDAVKPYMNTQADAQMLEQKINRATRMEPSQPVTITAAMDSPEAGASRMFDLRLFLLLQ